MKITIKILLIIIVFTTLLLSSCKNPAGNSEEDGNGGDTTDTASPTPGGAGAISFSAVLNNDITVSWTKATDDVSAQANLEYLVYFSPSNDIDTVANAEANGTAVGSWATDLSTRQVSGLPSSNTTYYFNVLVMDEVGKKAAYTTDSEATDVNFIWFDHFDYGGSDNNLETADGTNWTNAGGAGPSAQYRASGLSKAGYSAGTGGCIELGTGDEEDHYSRTFTAKSSGIMYFAVIVNPINFEGTNFTVGPAIGFGDASSLTQGFTFYDLGTDAYLRLNTQSTNQIAVSPATSDYLVVVKIDIDSDTTALFFNPDLSQSEPSANISLSGTVNACERVWLHGPDGAWDADWGGSDSTVQFDEIKIGKYWSGLSQAAQ